ncbi:MAG: hypothetical protein RIQ68_761 [Pseudomonadota bacterium]
MEIGGGPHGVKEQCGQKNRWLTRNPLAGMQSDRTPHARKSHPPAARDRADVLVISINIFNLLVNFFIGLVVAAFLGPDSFGRFAVALGAGSLLQSLFFGWLRLAAARFYSEAARTGRPDLRASLDAAFWVLGATTLGLGAIGALAAPLAGLDRDLVFWALAFCACNGAFEYQLALLRARFDDRAYALLIFAKNILSLALTAGVAWTTASPGLTLAGTAASVALSTLLLRARLKDPHARQASGSMAAIRETLAYALPLSFSLILFALIPLANRALGARFSDFAEAGQLALAQDVGLKLVLTIGTAMDQLLFQLAVREHETGGRSSGQAQVASNMTLMAALFLPALAGTWLVLPSFEVLIIPADYRGDFANALTILLPGLVCYGLMTFALAPAFQIAQRTWPVIAASVSACLADALLLALLPPTWDVDMLALAQSGALICGFLTLLALSPLAKPTWPKLRDLTGLVMATAGMTGAVWPLREMTPGLNTLIAQASLGGAAYLIILVIFDVADLRRYIGVRRALRSGSKP